LLAPDPKLLAVAMAVDALFGDPPNAVHPVAWIGRLAQALVRRAPQRGRAPQLIAGTLVVVVVCAASLGTLSLLDRALGGRPALAFLVEAFLLKCTFAFKGLGRAGKVVRTALANGRIDEARLALRALCSRDPFSLSGAELAAGTVESLAENLSDSFVAPLLAYAIFGLPGAVVYRAANTLDAMIGYRGRYEFLGKYAARLDDLLNVLPARLTAALLLAAGALAGGNAREGLRILRRDRALTASPNAGWPMAAMAGLLGVCLAKPGHYRLGDGGRDAGWPDIDRAWRIVSVAAVMAGVVALMIALGWGVHGGG